MGRRRRQSYGGGLRKQVFCQAADIEHTAHHCASGVPLYNLPRMQWTLGQSADIVAWRSS